MSAAKLPVAFVLLTVAAVCHAEPQAQCPRASVELSHETPGDFHSDCKGAERNLANLQDDFDAYSWETFIALNWPALANGQVDTAEVIGDTQSGDHQTVWESWKPLHEVFRDEGQTPEPWGTAHQAPDYWRKGHPGIAQCKNGVPLDKSTWAAIARGNEKFISKIAKGHSWFQTDQPFNTGPLIDQAGKYARFEILINQDMFEYIRDNELYSQEGQSKFTKPIVFPCGEFKAGSSGKNGRPVTEKVGAIVVKAAWKVLTSVEIASGRFHMRRALLATPSDEASTGERAECLQHAVIGLVGLHIVHKSKDVVQWNWSTFEHVDNNPEAGAIDAKRNYSFYSHDAKGRPDINTPPPRPWNPLVDEGPARQSQIVRMIPLTSQVRAINARYQQELRHANKRSVWQYYQLISTQWPTRPSSPAPGEPNTCNVQEMTPADVLGGPAPVFLGNSMLESYIQETVPNTSSSCMDCHANATTHDGRFSDFTFILERAKHRPATAGAQP